MRPEVFATHSEPINKTAYFTVYRPNLGYREDARIERCDELGDILFAINKINHELRKINVEHKRNFKKIQNLDLSDRDKKLLMVAMADEHKKLKQPYIDRLSELAKEKDVIKKKMGIIGQAKEKLSFHSILIHELFRFLTKEQGDIALERTRERCRELKIQY